MAYDPASSRSAWSVRFLALFVLACGTEPNAVLAPLGPDARILAFGDSLTHGSGAAPGEDYPEVLSRLIGRPVMNAGVPGETTTAALRRLPGELDRHEPHLVLLCLGGNDMLRRQDRDTMKRNLEQMLDLILERGSQVVLIGVPEPSLLGLDAEPRYAELAQEYGIAFEANALSRVLSDSSRRSDAIHPNARGYEDLAQSLANLLRRAGAV